MQKLLMVACLFLCVTAGMAASVNNTVEDSTKTQNTTVATTTIDSAQDWGLTLSEWSQYQSLMQGQNRLWYKKLTPAAVLGINAQTAEEQQHFAEIVARLDHDRLARELSFNNAVYQATLRLYSDEPVIKPFGLSTFNPFHAPVQNKNKNPAG